VRDDLVARDLRVFVLLGHGDSGGGIAAFQAALEEVERLRAACGYDTARWLAAQGTALLVLERQKDALPLLELANEMVPGRHGTLLNLGVAYRRTNRLEEAERALVAARRVRPWLANVVVNLALVTADKGDLDGAMALANELPETGDEAWRRPDLLGHLHYRRAVLQWEEHRAAAQAAAAEAYRYLRQAGQLPGAPRKRIAAVTGLARMLRDGDETRGFVHLLQVQADDPLNPFQLDAIATLLPADHLDGDAILALRSFLRSLVIALAPGNAALRKQQERLREFEQRQGKKR
jgi:hypothetical protein